MTRAREYTIGWPLARSPPSPTPQPSAEGQSRAVHCRVGLCRAALCRAAERQSRAAHCRVGLCRAALCRAAEQGGPLQSGLEQSSPVVEAGRGPEYPLPLSFTKKHPHHTQYGLLCLGKVVLIILPKHSTEHCPTHTPTHTPNSIPPAACPVAGCGPGRNSFCGDL